MYGSAASLGGTLLQRAADGRLSAAERGREIERVRDATELWSPFDGPLPGTSGAEIAVCEGYLLAYRILEDGAALLAATGSVPEDLRIRRVEVWTPYGVDATREFTMP